MLKLIVHHAPSLVGFLIGLKLQLSGPQFDHVTRMADSLITSEGKHKTIASLYELVVDAPDASNGCDTLRLAPWVAEDIRQPKRQFVVEDMLRYAEASGEKTI